MNADRTESTSTRSVLADLGAVVIGRNEGDRLRRSLRSVVDRVARVVYVDSGSTDDSVAFAASLGIEVVPLDGSIPFTAARARNAGFDRLRAIQSGLSYVQFIDGDSEIVAGWLEAACEHLKRAPEVSIVCGHCRERHPESSVYNTLCDIEWRGSIGEIHACGGIFMARIDALVEMDGFDATLTAGEEPELCFRLRQGGTKIWRIDRDMARHDADLRRFRQWWKRHQRTGHAYAEVAWRHVRSPGRFRQREIRSILLWASILPLLTLFMAVAVTPWFLFLLLAYPLQAVRIYRGSRAQGHGRWESWAYAVSCVVAKFAQLLGLLRFLRAKIQRRRPVLIEHR